MSKQKLKSTYCAFFLAGAISKTADSTHCMAFPISNLCFHFLKLVGCLTLSNLILALSYSMMNVSLFGLLFVMFSLIILMVVSMFMIGLEFSVSFSL